jgi:hypothetical protein
MGHKGVPSLFSFVADESKAIFIHRITPFSRPFPPAGLRAPPHGAFRLSF